MQGFQYILYSKDCGTGKRSKSGVIYVGSQRTHTSSGKTNQVRDKVDVPVCIPAHSSQQPAMVPHIKHSRHNKPSIRDIFENCLRFPNSLYPLYTSSFQAHCTAVLPCSSAWYLLDKACVWLQTYIYLADAAAKRVHALIYFLRPVQRGTLG